MNTLEQARVEWLPIKTNPNIKSIHNFFFFLKILDFIYSNLFFCKNPKGLLDLKN